MTIKNILFNIDDVLYDSSLQMSTARLNAVKAMIDTGLPSDIETSYLVLEKIVEEHGQYYSRHFDELLERLGLKWEPRIIASGVIAYRETSAAYLKPYPDTIPSLLKLREMGYKLYVVDEGRSVKQWQKLVQLGVQHLFHEVYISEGFNKETVDYTIFEEALDRFEAKAGETLFISHRLEPDINIANKLGLTTVLIAKGSELSQKKTKPGYMVSRLRDLFPIL